MFTALAKFLNRYSPVILGLSIIAIVLASVYGFGVFSRLDQGDLADRNSESTQVVNEITDHFSKGSPQVIVLFTSRNQETVDSPQFRQEVLSLLDKVKGYTTSIQSYYSTGAKQLVSADRKSTYASLVLPGSVSGQSSVVATLRSLLKSDGLNAYVGGQAAINADVNDQIHKDLSRAEVISFVALAILLVIVFRSVIAALLPLALGGFAILGAFAVTRLLTNVTTISQYAINIITLLGLGLAIDYSLFMVSRFREELHKSRDVEAALTRTMETAGHTIFFSALTVIASLLCMQVFPVDFLKSMSLGGAAAVLVALIAAMLVLPAILRLLGIKIDILSFGSARRNANAIKDGRTIKEEENVWHRLGRTFMRFKWASVIIAIFILGAAGLPFLSAHFSTPDYRTLPQGSEARYVSEKLVSDFGDPSEPLHILYTTPTSVTSSNSLAGLYAYIQKIRSLSQVDSTESIVDLPQITTLQQYQHLYAGPLPATVQQVQNDRIYGNTTLIDVNYRGTLDASATQQLVDQLRNLQKPNGVDTKVGGGPAILHDLLATLGKYIPYGVIALIVTLFILLFLLSRSVVIPIQAILLSTLSLGAAFGALVWIFQEGHWTNLFNLTQTGSLDATMPILIFTVAFGLSVDYSVFLYSRIREQYDTNGKDNAAAILTGLQKTGSIITSAAILLFIVVSAFATGRIPIMQEIGVGLALTVLIDAFVIRMAVVPAVMSILGHANWWAPKFLRKK